MKEHHYHLKLRWTGNSGGGTIGYAAYSRDHEVSVAGKPVLLCSSDAAFRGDASRYNPEELFLASIANCHMLWYLHLCADAGITVTSYTDEPTGVMIIMSDGGGYFQEVSLHPVVSISSGSPDVAKTLHVAANEKCFIANSCNFPIRHYPVVSISSAVIM
jgi:organic hydroperoxide reductase OsmC/OhrA